MAGNLKPWVGITFLFVPASISAALPYSEKKEDKKSNRPNILVIMADDLPNNALSCYGSIVNKTPNIDRIAREGMRFNNAFVTTSLSGPSRACILTGTYPHVNHQVTIDRLFSFNQPTFPMLLQQSGYQTAIIGKWHLWAEPQGFDYWSILDGQGPYFDPPMINNGIYSKQNGYTTDVITDMTIGWLEKCDRRKPFCLLCNHKAPHWIPEPDSIHEHMFEGVNLPEPQGFNDTHETRISDRSEDWNVATLHETSFFKNHPRWKSLPQGLDSSERKRDNYQRYVKDMLRAIASLDDNIGRLLDYLDRSGLSENTIVVITSDNGYFIGEHGWIDKKVVYDESIRIPLVVRWPGYIPPSSVNDEFVLNIDFAPTWLNIAGVTVPGSMQGRSIYPLFSGKIPTSWRNSVYLQYYTINRFPYYAIRTRDYKLIHFYDPAINGWEFYDLKKDPNEMVNAYNNPAYRKVIMDLTRQLTLERSRLSIDSTLENNIYRESKTGVWSRELKQYNAETMTRWKAAH